MQNFPNPFNSATTIRNELPSRSIVKIQIFIVLGQMLKELINYEQEAGYQSVIWNASNVDSGLYFYRLEAVDLNNPTNRYVDSKKMILLK